VKLLTKVWVPFLLAHPVQVDGHRLKSTGHEARRQKATVYGVGTLMGFNDNVMYMYRG